jgi:OOP family OmpA-OmpF porin
MRTWLSMAVAVGTLWTGQALAVTTAEDEVPYVGAAYAHEFADSDRDSSGGNGFQLHFGMPLPWGENNAAEASFYNISRSRNIDDKDDYQAVIGLDVVHDFGLYGWGDANASQWLPKFKPFILGGILGVRDDVRGTKTNAFGLDLGTGVLVPLPWFGAAARIEGRVQGQSNSDSVPGQDLLIDYRINLGVQVPLSPFFHERKTDLAPAQECELAVVNPETGRSDCGADSDRDGVLDGVDQCPGTSEGSPVDQRGCPTGDAPMPVPVPVPEGAPPPAPAGEAAPASGANMSLQNVYFGPDSAELSAVARKTLDDAAAVLRAQPSLRVEIGGHTDPGGSQAYNLMLSQERAESVRQYLISAGIDADRLATMGYGEFRPRASSTDTAESRRVEFRLIVE